MSPEEAGPVSLWIRQLKSGDAAAAQRLWELYYARLLKFASRRRRGLNRPGAVSDAEDAAQSAFKSFCLGAARGRFPQIGDRVGLWRLLLAITSRKVVDHQDHEHRRRRGGGKVYAASELEDALLDDPVLARVIGREPTPEFAALAAEQYERLIGSLAGEDLRTIARMKMEGYTNGEIAERIGAVRRTVIRKLEVIRRSWREEALR
jgi:DNA-directed RNA polymerase specialized sigma24 family protein